MSEVARLTAAVSRGCTTSQSLARKHIQMEMHHAFGMEKRATGGGREGVHCTAGGARLLPFLKIAISSSHSMFSLPELLFFRTPLSLSCIHFTLTFQND